MKLSSEAVAVFGVYLAIVVLFVGFGLLLYRQDRDHHEEQMLRIRLQCDAGVQP